MYSEEVAELMKTNKQKAIKLVNALNKETVRDFNEMFGKACGIELGEFKSKPSSNYRYSHMFDERENTVKVKLGSTSFNLRLPLKEENQVMDLKMLHDGIMNARLRITYVSQRNWFDELKEQIKNVYEKDKLAKDLFRDLGSKLADAVQDNTNQIHKPVQATKKVSKI